MSRRIDLVFAVFIAIGLCCGTVWAQEGGQSSQSATGGSSAATSGAQAPSGQSGSVAPGSPSTAAPSDTAKQQQIIDAAKKAGIAAPGVDTTAPKLGEQRLDNSKPVDTKTDVLKQMQQQLDGKNADKLSQSEKPADKTSEKTENKPEDEVDNAIYNKKKTRANPYTDIPSLYNLYKQVNNTSAVTRFGSALFANSSGNTSDMPMDLPVGPDYVLGPGDGLKIDVWGSVSDSLQRVVDRQGKITLPEVGSIQAAGLTLAAMQRAVESLMNSRFRNVRSSVSLAQLRSVRVYVVGDVQRPGAYDINSMSTVLNALMAAGGPTERGSMRIAKHYRGQQLVEEIDMYDLILRGVRSDMQRLQPGDTVMISPVADQVTVEGMVHRPAIYELHGEHSLAEVLAMAGGVLPTGTIRHIEVERIQAHEKRTMLSLDLPENADASAADRMVQEFQVHDQDVVRIWPIYPYSEKTIFLMGHVLRPGKYSYREGMTVRDLIKSSVDLLPEPSIHAEVIRLMPPEFRPVVISFAVSPSEGKVDAVPLTPFDTVRFFSKYDFQDAPSVTIYGEVRDPGTHKLNGETRLRDAIYMAGGFTSDALMQQAQVYRSLQDSNVKVFTVDLAKAMAGDATENIVLNSADTIVIHANLAKLDPPKVYIQGEVVKPGAYPLSAGMKATDLVQMAGGFTRGAYLNSADLTRYDVYDKSQINTNHTVLPIGKAMEGDKAADVELQEGDVLAIRQITGWADIGSAVTVRGEVGHAGTFGLQEGERLSSVLRRAGGFRSTAYPRGIVLERDAVRQLAEKTKAELIDQLETQQMQPVQFQSNVSPAAAQAQLEQMTRQRQQLLDRLRKQPASGRMTVTIGPKFEEWEGTPADVQLRAGDVISIPKQPSFVLVSGEVYGPTALSYQPGRNASWYIQHSGGMTEFANKKNVFVVRADGTVIGSGSQNVFSYKPKPGDAVVVPQKIAGGTSAWKYIGETAQFLTSIALAAAAISNF